MITVSYHSLFVIYLKIVRSPFSVILTIDWLTRDAVMLLFRAMDWPLAQLWWSPWTYCLRIWNPATRTISKKIGYFPNGMDQLKLWKFVFGYENLTNTYKVAALHRGSNRTTEARVLSFGINIWRNIQSFPGVPLQLMFPRSCTFELHY